MKPLAAASEGVLKPISIFQFYTSWKSIARQIFSWMTIDKQSIPKCILKDAIEKFNFSAVDVIILSHQLLIIMKQPEISTRNQCSPLQTKILILFKVEYKSSKMMSIQRHCGTFFVNLNRSSNRWVKHIDFWEIKTN